METEDILTVEAHLAACDGRAYSQEDREHIIKTVFACMEAGESMSAACIRLQVTPGTLWRWLNADVELQQVYENIKKSRARAMIEAALYEIQTNKDIKVAEGRARIYMRLAALLNPKEFSDKLHAAGSKAQLGSGRVSFVLNIGQQPTHHKGELTVIEQPEDGD